MALAFAAPAETQVTDADYERAERFLSWNLSELVQGPAAAPEWLDADRFLLANRTAEGMEFVVVNAATGDRERAFDQERLAAALAEVADTVYDPYDLPFQRFQLIDDELRFDVGLARWACDLDDYACLQPDSVPEVERNGIPSPNGDLVAFIRDHDLWVLERETGEERQLTEDGRERFGYATDSQGWRRTEMPVLLWSPDSRSIATYRLDERQVPDMHLLRTAEPRPELESWPYALPGDSIVPLHERVVVHLDNPGGAEVVRLRTPADHQRTSSCCGLTRGEAWADVEWSDDAERLAFVSTSRDYTTVTLRLSDPATGETRTVLSERQEPFFESSVSGRGVPNWRVLHESGEVIWFSRRDGWGHLYLYDLESGALRSRITSGDWNVLDLLHVDEEQRSILFTAVGREAERDPYFRHLYRVSMDGGEPELLTPEDADHDVAISPSGRHFVETRSRRDEAPVTIIRRADGTEVATVEEADLTRLLETGWPLPIPFTVQARDGETDLYGMMYRPSDFDPERRYPVVNSIYPGPQAGSVGPRSFTVNPRGQAQALAELGFIVVQIDALGTPMRSLDFHAAYHGDLADNGLPDQIAGMRQLAGEHPYMDLDRVGMYGHSGGGFATAAAMLRHPEFFHVGVASAGNHDNRGYTYYWGEKWQGRFEAAEGDEEDSYAVQALHEMAENLEGKLLLSYGTIDSNVHPNMTLLLVDALIEHNKDFDLMVFPNRGHGYANETYNLRRTWDYFVQHLLGEEPPAEYRIER